MKNRVWCQTYFQMLINLQVTNLDEAHAFIEDLKEKFRAQGQQVIAYRRKLRQQVRNLKVSNLTRNQ